MSKLLVILMLSLLSISAFADSAPVSSEVFLAKMQLKEGSYALVSGYDKVTNSDSCQEGPLEVFAVGGGLTLKLGANPLIVEIGRDNYKDTSAKDCSYVYSGSLAAGKVKGTMLADCKGRPALRNETSVISTAAGFDYHRVVKYGEKLIHDETCHLRRN